MKKRINLATTLAVISLAVVPMLRQNLGINSGNGGHYSIKIKSGNGGH